MKRTKLGLLFALSGAMILASCGASAPKAKKYNLTFHQTEPGEIQDVVVVVTKGKTTNQEVWEQEPEINPKVGYTAAGWEEYDVEAMEADLTVEPVYTVNHYTATFVNDVTGETIGTDDFTVEDDSLDYPALPTEVGYTYAWESVTISAQNLTVHCSRTANVHTIKFFADEGKTQQVGETLQFTIETESIVEPAVPARDGYDGSWPEYNLAGDQDIEVVAQYVLHSYYLQFKVDGENIGSPVGYNVSDTWASIQKPTASITGYTVTWPESVELQFAEQDNPQVVNGTKTANQYTVHYEGLEATTSVTYDSAYQLEALDPIYAWFNGDVEIAQSGTAWTIADDVTLTKKVVVNTKVLGFEDPRDATLFKIHDRFDSIEIVDGEGIDGSKALKVSRAAESGADAHLDISKEYLDLVFADPNVKSLSFYAKGTVATNNFRHKQVDAQYVNNNSNIVSCYEKNSAGYGITTTYKQFYLTRGVYSQMSASDWFIQYGGISTADLYLDNFQVSTEDYYGYKKDSLEYGYFEKNSDTAWYLRDAASGQANILITTGNAANTVDLEYENISDGHRAIKINKTTNNTVSIYLRGDLQYNNLPDEGILIDFYTTVGFNAWWENQETGAISNGYDKHFAFATSYNYGVRDSRWHTLHIPKADINNDGGKIMNLKSPVGTMYIDNIRVATHLTESFESAKAFHIGEYGYGVGFNLADATAANNCRDNTKNYMFMVGWAVCTAAEISDEHQSRGAYSLKITKKSNGTFSINPKWGELMDDDSTLSFDIYSEDANRTTCNTSGTSARQLSFTLGEWCTITLTKADLENDSSRFSTDAFGAGTFYFDNFVLAL